MPEFDRRVIEALREPMEEGVVRLARSKGSLILPAQPMIIATANPCPCGYRGSGTGKRCICKASDIQRYDRKLSGPFMDRIDIFVDMAEPFKTETGANKRGPHSDRSELTTLIAKDLVQKARKLQFERCKKYGLEPMLNSEIRLRDMNKLIVLNQESEVFLYQGIKNFNLSLRGKHRVMKVARTIADLGGSENIETAHVLEALSFRQKNN